MKFVSIPDYNFEYHNNKYKNSTKELGEGVDIYFKQCN